MRGLFVSTGRAVFREDLPEPGGAPGEGRVRVLRAGICATDLALLRGYMGFRGIPGHEFVGQALDGPLAGQRVVGEINAACGECAACRRGLGRHCPRRTVLGIHGRPGAFAEVLTLPAVNLRPVPDTVPTDRAVFAEPLAAAFEITEQVQLESGMTALVVGDGRLGLLCAQVLTLHGVEVTLAGHHPERSAWLPDIRHHLGLPAGRDLFDLAVEATGHPAVFAEVVPRVRPRGTVVLKTTSEELPRIDLAPVVVNELTVVGSRCGVFEPALEALATGSVVVDPFIDARYPLERGVEALGHAARAGVLKVLLDIA